jgi:hypothetical protein
MSIKCVVLLEMNMNLVAFYCSVLDSNELHTLIARLYDAPVTVGYIERFWATLSLCGYPNRTKSAASLWSDSPADSAEDVMSWIGTLVSSNSKIN